MLYLIGLIICIIINVKNDNGVRKTKTLILQCLKASKKLFMQIFQNGSRLLISILVYIYFDSHACSLSLPVSHILIMWSNDFYQHCLLTAPFFSWWNVKSVTPHCIFCTVALKVPHGANHLAAKYLPQCHTPNTCQNLDNIQLATSSPGRTVNLLGIEGKWEWVYGWKDLPFVSLEIWDICFNYPAHSNYLLTI